MSALIELSFRPQRSPQRRRLGRRLMCLAIWACSLPAFADDVRVILVKDNVARESSGDVEVSEVEYQTPGSVAVPVDATLRRRLEQAGNHVSGEHAATAALTLGRLAESLDGTDVFIRAEGGSQRRVSFRQEIQRRIAALPPEARNAYAVIFAAQAKAMLAAAVVTNDEAALQRVAGLYTHTPAGAEALYRLGRWQLDRGQYGLAATCFSRLATDHPSAAGAFEPGLSAAAAFCRAALRPDAAVTLSARRPLLIPRWSQSLAVGEAAARLEAERPLGAVPAVMPTVVGDLVLLRSGSGFSVFGLHDGQLRWTCPTAADAVQVDPEQFWGDPTAGGISTDGEAVYLVESDTGIDPRSAVVQNEVAQVWNGPMFARARFRGNGLSSETNALRSPSASTLSALAIRPPQQGNRRWRVGGQSGCDEPALAGFQFLGPPLATGGRIYALADHGSKTQLVVLDTEKRTIAVVTDFGRGGGRYAAAANVN